MWIRAALDQEVGVLEECTPGAIESTLESGGDPLTETDLAVDRILRSTLPADDQGWLPEETADSSDRLSRPRVWIVDPIDGTREFIDGIPESCVSIGLIEDGQPVAGGMHNPATGEGTVGAVSYGVDYTGPHQTLGASTLREARFGVSRSEVRRGEWDRYGASRFTVVPMGSVAYELALVASGQLDATGIRNRKNEWDIAGGAALIAASGGWAAIIDGSAPTGNNRNTLISGP
jgi:myo-inositol-1(or 4)-monophosphatase